MTTNQTIDGVSRKSLEQALKLAAVFDDGGDGADAESARGVVWILRALLDAPAVLGEIDLTPKRLAHAEIVIEQQNNLIASLRAELVESYRVAAQPQGEPVGWQIRSRTDRPDSVWTGWRECSEMERAMHSHEVGKFNRFGIMREIRPLYATRAAPAPLDCGSLDPVQRLAVCRGDVVPASAAPAEPDPIKGMIETIGGQYAVMIDPESRHYGWTFKKHPAGQWVSGRKATEREMIAARSHAQITNQL